MHRLDICEHYCQQIGQTHPNSRRTLLQCIRAHVDVFEYASHFIAHTHTHKIKLTFTHRFIGDVAQVFSSFILVQGILSLMLITVTIFYSKIVSP